MERAGGGDLYHFTASPAALGVAVHLITGAGWGIVFALLVRALQITRIAVVPLGAVFGVAVMLVMAYAALPIVAGAFDSGAPIRDMPSMVGWGTFAIEHLIFGVVTGVAALGIAPGAQVVRDGEHVRSGRQRATNHGVHAS